MQCVLLTAIKLFSQAHLWDCPSTEMLTKDFGGSKQFHWVTNTQLVIKKNLFGFQEDEENTYFSVNGAAFGWHYCFTICFLHHIEKVNYLFRSQSSEIFSSIKILKWNFIWFPKQIYTHLPPPWKPNTSSWKQKNVLKTKNVLEVKNFQNFVFIQ